MGYQQDQRLPSERSDENADPPPTYRPALPPRKTTGELTVNANNGSPSDSGHLIPEIATLRRSQFTWTTRDPRNSSTESLLPDSDSHGKRKLLLIYIHGFMGSETSFQAFPAHVHSLVSDLVVETHIVHTKIYPRYKSRRSIEIARDDFSNWLQPHIDSETDVILLGHSMGGIVSAEVVLQPSNSRSGSPLLNKILGTINFDVPFLGMHPGVIASGIGSLFRPADKVPEGDSLSSRSNEVVMPMSEGYFDLGKSTNNSTILSRTSSATPSESLSGSDRLARSMSPLSVPVDDPNYNPKFDNDVIRPVRKGWDSAIHFVTKHSGNLRSAAKAYVTSHVEFGGTMADYHKLRVRYKKLRALEDVKSTGATGSRSDLPRVRFVNFYTASTGRPKSKSRSPSVENRGRQLHPGDIPTSSSRQSLSSQVSSSRSLSPRISVETPDGILQSIEMDDVDPIAWSDDEQEAKPVLESIEEVDSNSKQPQEQDDGLPPIPPEPTAPEPFDPSSYPEKDILKIAQKDHARKMKAYQSAMKDREKSISERKKLLDKREKKAAKEREKAEKDAKKSQSKKSKEKEKTKPDPANQPSEANKTDESPAEATTESTSAAPSTSTQSSTSRTPSRSQTTITSKTPPTTAPTSLAQSPSSTPTPSSPTKHRSTTTKPPRDRKFCILPPKNPDGQRDPAWVRVFMAGVDEVGAHCGLFMAEKQHYEGFIGAVGEVVARWILDSRS